MNQEQRRLIHDAVLKARSLLEEEIASLLEGTYGLHADGTLEEASSLPLVKEDPEAGLTRKALEDYLSEQEEAGQTREEAVSYLIKETAFTHLNRLVAIKMMEARNLIRGTVNCPSSTEGPLLTASSCDSPGAGSSVRNTFFRGTACEVGSRPDRSSSDNWST